LDLALFLSHHFFDAQGHDWIFNFFSSAIGHLQRREAARLFCLLTHNCLVSVSCKLWSRMDADNDREEEDVLNQFKVDIASLADGPAARLVLYNVNIPRRLWQDEPSMVRVRDIVVRDFGNVSGVYFQLSATYTLVNRETGEIRTWSGSFNPRNRDICELTSHLSFEPDTFVQFVLAHSLPEWVFDKLNAGAGQLTAGRTSVWVLDDVKSIIASFQGRLGISHSLFSRYPPLNWWRRNRRNVAGTGRKGVRVHLD
jgi:hypothetical protein